MSIFCFKPIAPTERLGARLKEAREAKKISLAKLSQSTRLPARYLTAIEAGDFRRLPPSAIFRRAYIKEYARAVGLSADECVLQLIEEAGLLGTSVVHPKRTPFFSPLAILPTALRTGMLLGVAILFALYLAWQISGVLKPPTLTLFSPLEGQVINNLTTVIEGQTDPEVTLSINGEKAGVGDQGQFAAKVDLAPGLNTLVITAVKKHGKTTTKTLHLVTRGRSMPEPRPATTTQN